MTATDEAKPNEPAKGESTGTGGPKAPSDGAKPSVAAPDAKPETSTKPPADAKPDSAAKPAAPTAPAKPSAEPKPGTKAKPSAEGKPAAPAKSAATAKPAAKDAPAKGNDSTRTVPAAKPAAKDAGPVKAVPAAKPADTAKPAGTAAAAATAVRKPAAAAATKGKAKPAAAAAATAASSAKDKDATPTKVDGERIDVLASKADAADAADGDVPGKDAAARRADKDAPTVPPKRRWDRWYWVVGRGFATAVIGVAAIMLGVFVLPKFVDTTVSSSQGPQSPFSSGPDIPGSVPGNDQSGSPTPGTTLPTPNGPVQTQAGRPADALGAWAVNLNKLGIPQVALQAYGYAESVLAKTQPGCHLSWTLLAGIGSIESNHGRHGNATLQADGTSQPKIVGIQLSGATTERITDSDQGKLDGDAQFDRAMGAMQFIPTTWSKWAIDADNDGKADPYDLDDAAVSSAYYLCAGGRDLATAEGWWSAVLSYNNLTSYATSVYTAADNYGVQSTK